MDQTNDPLSACLLWLAAENGTATSHDALVGGLPLVDGRLSPSVFARAADRVDMKVKLVRQPLEHLNSLLLPCVVFYRGLCGRLVFDTVFRSACTHQDVGIAGSLVAAMLGLIWRNDQNPPGC